MKLTKECYLRTCFAFFLLGITNLLVPASAYADGFSWWQQRTWRPVVSVGIGTATTSDAGTSQNFPVQDSITDEFYDYSVYHVTQTSALFDVFLGAEWQLYPKWLLQGGLDYNQASPFTVKGSYLQGADIPSADTYTYHYGVIARQLLLEGKLLYSIKEYYHPYLLAGLGTSFNTAYNYYTNTPPFLTFTRMYSNNTSSTFTYAMGVGIDIDCTPHTRFGVGYRFADLGKVQLGHATIDTSSVSGSLSQTHLYMNELLAQISWID